MTPSGWGRVRRWGLILPTGVFGLIILAPVAALAATTWVLGWRLQVVQTSSMRPLYPAGSLVAVEPIDGADVEVGMVIVFRDPARRDRVVAHRVVKRLSVDPPSWQTQGDANREPDPWPISAEDVRGRIRWGVPSLGKLVSALSGWRGPVALVGGPLGLLLLSELSAGIRRQRTRPRAFRPDALAVGAGAVELTSPHRTCVSRRPRGHASVVRFLSSRKRRDQSRVTPQRRAIRSTVVSRAA